MKLLILFLLTIVISVTSNSEESLVCSSGQYVDPCDMCDVYCKQCNDDQHSDGTSTSCEDDNITSCPEGKIFHDGSSKFDGSCADVEITFDSTTYEVCDGISTRVIWNGNHNIQEVTATGYDTYNSDQHVGSEIHGLEDSGHKQMISGLNAGIGETRYFVCTYHPSSKFKTMCPGTPVTQTWDLHVGWNWVAMSVQLDGDTEINNVLSTSVFENGDELLSSNGDSASYSSSQSKFIGSTVNMDMGQPLKLKMNTAKTIQLTGTIPLSHTLDFPVGWSWTGLPISADLPIGDFLPDIWETGDKILSEDEGSVTYFSARSGWDGGWYPSTGPLTHLKPGKMYKFKRSNAIQVTYPEGRRRFLRTVK